MDLVLSTYCNVVILCEDAVEEPHGGTKCQEKRQRKWHVFHTFGSYYLPLQHCNTCQLIDLEAIEQMAVITNLTNYHNA